MKIVKLLTGVAFAMAFTVQVNGADCVKDVQIKEISTRGYENAMNTAFAGFNITATDIQERSTLGAITMAPRHLDSFFGGTDASASSNPCFLVQQFKAAIDAIIAANNTSRGMSALVTLLTAFEECIKKADVSSLSLIQKQMLMERIEAMLNYVEMNEVTKFTTQEAVAKYLIEAPQLAATVANKFTSVKESLRTHLGVTAEALAAAVNPAVEEAAVDLAGGEVEAHEVAANAKLGFLGYVIKAFANELFTSSTDTYGGILCTIEEDRKDAEAEELATEQAAAATVIQNMTRKKDARKKLATLVKAAQKAAQAEVSSAVQKAEHKLALQHPNVPYVLITYWAKQEVAAKAKAAADALYKLDVDTEYPSITTGQILTGVAMVATLIAAGYLVINSSTGYTCDAEVLNLPQSPVFSCNNDAYNLYYNLASTPNVNVAATVLASTPNVNIAATVPAKLLPLCKTGLQKLLFGNCK